MFNCETSEMCRRASVRSASLWPGTSGPGVQTWQGAGSAALLEKRNHGPFYSDREKEVSLESLHVVAKSPPTQFAIILERTSGCLSLHEFLQGTDPAKPASSPSLIKWQPGS